MQNDSRTRKTALLVLSMLQPMTPLSLSLNKLSAAWINTHASYFIDHTKDTRRHLLK